MKKKFLIFTLCFFCLSFFSSDIFGNPDTTTSPGPSYSDLNMDKERLNMIIPPGQISGRLLRVFVPGKEITPEMDPVLLLKRKKDKKNWILTLQDIAVNQAYTEEVDGMSITRTGTMLLFSTQNIIIPFYSPSLRATPVLTFRIPSSGVETKIIYPSCTFIGNGIGAALWTVVSIALLLIIISRLLIVRGKRQFLGIITDEDDQVSMSLLQMWLWTLAVGSMVLAFGLLSLEVPDIPETLIMLMLFAAATTTFGQYQTKIRMRKERELKKKSTGQKDNSNMETVDDYSFWGKINTVFYASKGSSYPSMAKVQVLVWTAITLILFIYLSINEGKLWDVPPELVALMGISQAAFLGRQQIAIQDVNEDLKEAVRPPKRLQNPRT